MKLRFLITVLCCASVSQRLEAAPVAGGEIFQRTTLDAEALMMPKSTYGRSINGVSFQQSALLSHGGYQYAAWYTLKDRQVVLGRRPIGSSTWEKAVLASALDNGGPRKGDPADRGAWNAHNVISLGICPNDGTLHMAWDMHSANLRYRVSQPGLIPSSPDAPAPAWNASMMNPEQDWLIAPAHKVTRVTYPRFLTLPDGNLLLGQRFGTSANGDYLICRYNAKAGTAGTWDKPRTIISRAGKYADQLGSSGSRNPYLNGINVGPDGTLYISWNWRETPGGLGNHSICFALSRDGGDTWLNTLDKVVATASRSEPITIDSLGIAINKSDRTMNAINQQAQTLDSAGRMHILMYHRKSDAPAFRPGDSVWDTAVTAYHHYVRDPKTGQWTTHALPGKVGSRPKIACDASGNAFAVYSQGQDLVVQMATAASGYSNWRAVISDETGYACEPHIDAARLTLGGVLSIFAQRSTPESSSPSGTALEVLEVPISSITR